MKRITPRATLFAAFVLILSAGCADPDTDAAVDATVGDTNVVEPVEMAVAELQPTEGNEVTGRVTFTPQGGAMQVVADIQNLSEGTHGFHIHENGTCAPGEDGTPGGAAGGHFNPNDDPHGAPTDPPGEHHTGDMGNIMADASGTARVDTSFAFLSLEGDTSIVNKAVIVHSGRDDLTSQPSGDAGDRLACGVVQMQGDMMNEADTTGQM